MFKNGNHIKIASILLALNPLCLFSQMQMDDASIDEKLIQVVDHYLDNHGHLGQDGPIPINIHKTGFWGQFYLHTLQLDSVYHFDLEALDSCLFYINGFGDVDFILNLMPDTYFYYRDRLILTYDQDDRPRKIDKKFVRKLNRSFDYERFGHIYYSVWGLRLFPDNILRLVRIDCDDCPMVTSRLP